MKIAITTFVHAYNYGAELQCFALQNKLSRMGYNVSVLDIYRPFDTKYNNGKKTSVVFYKQYEQTGTTSLSRTLKIKAFKLLALLKKIRYNSLYVTRERNFENFHKQYTNLSKQVFTNFSDLYDMFDSSEYTHYIVGSDQVWNFSNRFPLDPYFLTFVKSGKKISYAASIGHQQIPDRLVEYYRERVADFDNISLREKQGESIIKGLTGREDIVTVLDPTLLLTKKEWIEQLEIQTKEEAPYIVMYLLSHSTFSIRLAKEIASFTGFKIKLITTDIVSNYHDNEIEFYNGVSPREFVRLFSSASFVVTNSFHGTAFAVNFNKPFFSTTRKDKSYNSRFINLLTKTNLLGHLLYEDETIPELSKDILSTDFSISNEQLSEERKYSLAFLKDALI